MVLAVTFLVQLFEDLLGQDLAQLDTPLVEAVDVPDGSLSEGEVLVVGNQSTQLAGADGATNQDGRRGAVAEESLVGNQVARRALSLHLLVRLANHQSLSLGQEVGGKHLLLQVVGNGVVGLSSQDEVSGDQLGSLVDKLEEGVLSVGARLTEQNRSCVLLAFCSVTCPVLTIVIMTYRWCT